MGVKLTDNNYGKADVRVMRVVRDEARHEIFDLNVQLMCRGDFSEAYRTGDNSTVLPTDTMRNAVYAHAKTGGIGTIEDFGLRLTEYLLRAQPSAGSATARIVQRRWRRIDVDGKPHDHSFVADDDARRVTRVHRGAGEVLVESGIEGLRVLKTTASGFSGFLRDEYTTLGETDDRLLSTVADVYWRYARSAGVDWDATWETVHRLTLETFATQHSLSVQHTQWAIADAILAACPDVAELDMAMPNKHHLPFDLGKLGLEWTGEVFHVVDEPAGVIEGTFQRDA